MACVENNVQEKLSREMIKAVESGDLPRVKDITAKYGLSHCEEWLDGCALVEAALFHDKPNTVKFLLEAGAKLSNSEETIYNFHEAVAKNVRYLPIVKLLLTKGASVRERNERGDSPLHCVRTVGIAKLLFSSHANTHPDLTATNSVGLTPLHVAARSNKHLTKFLLENGADVNCRATGKYELYTPLHFAAKSSKYEIVRLLLKNKALVNLKCKEGTPLHIACKSASPDIVRLLLDHLAEVEAIDEEGKTPIYRAIEHADSHALIVQSLLDKGAVLKPSPGLLYGALRHRCPELVEILIKHGCDVNERVEAQTGLHLMVYSDHYTYWHHGANNALKIVRLLLENGADVNAQSEETGATALLLAIQLKLFEVMPILLEFGADYQIPPTGDTLLHLCTKASRDVWAHTYKALLKGGADINARNASGETPLHLAAVNYHCLFCSIEALVSWPDVDIDAKDDKGSTALAKAAAGLFLVPLSALLSYGADVNIPNGEGLTPVQVVERYRLSRSERTYDDHVLRVSMALRSHVAKLKCADLPVSEDNLLACRYVGEKASPDRERRYTRTRETLDNPYFVKRCKVEVEKMKNERIGSSCVSYYDILSRSSRQVAIYTKNASVQRVMKPNKPGNKKFPVYGQWIKVRYRRAKRRVELQSKAVSSLSAMFEFLPHICCYLIADLLSNEDLKNCSDCYPGLDG